jgi:late competence protein required for DNA uptake (superfamily II DNA/RNA helicase)
MENEDIKLYEAGIKDAKEEIKGLRERIRSVESTIDAWQKKIDIIVSKQKGYGKCKRCNDPAVYDYNGYGYYLCRVCNEIMNDRFDEEYN